MRVPCHAAGNAASSSFVMASSAYRSAWRRRVCRWRCFAALGLLAGGAAVHAAPSTLEKGAWLDKSHSVDERVAALLSQMTLAEKIGQMRQTNGIGGDPTGDPKNLVAGSELHKLIREGRLGSILNEINPATINEFERLAVEESRLGIPLIIGRDVIHGYRTIMPIPIGQAASWNPELVEAGADVAGREARSMGIHWTFAPMVDIARDPRWGRIAEGYGEDPVLGAAMAAATVRGFQGQDLGDGTHVAACVKHFVGYGAAEGGRDYNNVNIPPSLMHNVYLPPFRAAVDAGAATLMSSFNDVNGVPMSGNAHLLRDVLRKQWGFRGFVVSDWESIREMIPHGTCADEKAAALAGAAGGVNMEMTSSTYENHLAELVKEGQISEKLIDDLVAEILRIKFQLGLFENSLVDAKAPTILLSEKHLDVARRIARQSVVLLKNDKQSLPIDASAESKVKTIAVVGPLADAPLAQLGTWIPDGRQEESHTVLAALREAAAAHGQKLLYARGLADDLDRKTDGFAEAVAATKQADLVLLFVGERAGISGEASSRAIIDLPGAQNQLAAAVAAAGKPTVLVVQAGRPLTVGVQIAQVDAVLYSFHAGTMAGPALADLLWGVESPSGKLPVQLLKTVGQIPLYYNHVNSGRPPRPYDFAKDNSIDDQIKSDLGYNSNYLDIGPYPLYPFGYGLSYAQFEYGKVELSTGKLSAGQTLAVRAPVTNKSAVAADEVVQLYVRDLVGSLTRPVRELKAFRRVHFEPGETHVIELALPADSLAYYNNEEQRLLEPGTFEVYVGGSSLAPLAGQFELK